MLTVIGSMQRDHELRWDSYVPGGNPLRIASEASPTPGVPYLYWFAGAVFPRSYIKITVNGISGLISGISLLNADVAVEFSDSLDSCSTRIPGVPFCDLKEWPRQGEAPLPDLRTLIPVGVAVRDRTAQVAILEAGDPAAVYTTGNVDIGIDRNWNLAIVQVRNLELPHVQVIAAAVAS